MKNLSFFCILTLTLLLLFPTAVSAQETTSKDSYASTYEAAERFYKIGEFNVTEELLLRYAPKMKGMRKTSAYRLLAICKIERGKLDEAKEYVLKMLESDPYYTPTLSDPQRLVDLVNEAKQQEAGVTTASRQAESVEEAPVPVTVITEDMIRHSGASTLQEVLCLFVPGMSVAEGVETNIAMHGIAGLSQEKILFLQDGHRLNSGSSNAEAPDYRNSLDKIQQIEVLRGPASSLYGNVALTAVVNIITRKGAILNGGRITGIAGTQSSYGGSFVVGGGNNVVDVMGWGSIYSTKGFKHIIENTSNPSAGSTTLYSHGYNKRPSYDIGIKARWGDFSMMINSQRSKLVPYLNVLQVPADMRIITDASGNVVGKSPTSDDFSAVQNYNYDRYAMISSNGPGTTRTNHRLNIDYSHSFGNINISASGYVSLENSNMYNVLGDSVDFNLGALLLQMTNLIDSSQLSSMGIGISGSTSQQAYQQTMAGLMKMIVKTQGVYEVMDWENITFGGQAQMLMNYNLLGKGTFVFGGQYEHFSLTNASVIVGGDYNSSSSILVNNIFDDGSESVISGYAQLKHYFSPRFILNAGMRYDHKIRFSSDRLNKFSPRLSLIYKLTNALSVRGSYNYSFVDAPYIYRASQITVFSGGTGLKPERMKSFQLGSTYHKIGSGFSAEISGYYNRLEDLINQNLGGSTTGYLFQNSGNVRQVGVEGALQYHTKAFMLNYNATWQKIIKSENYNVYYGNRLGIPQFMSNVFAACSPYSGKGTGLFDGGKLWINLTANAQTATYYQTVDLVTSNMAAQQGTTGGTSSLHNEYNRVAPQIVVGLGVSYEWKNLDLSLNLSNITNNQYKVGSTMSDGIPRAGRQFLAKVTVKF